MQIFIEDDNFDIISAIKSGFVEENEKRGPIIGYTYSMSRSFIIENGIEWFKFFTSGWEVPDTVRYKYRLHIDVKRAWKKFFSTGGGIEFVFSSKKNAEQSLNKIKKVLKAKINTFTDVP